MISTATGSQWHHERLHLSRKGRFWVEAWSPVAGLGAVGALADRCRGCRVAAHQQSRPTASLAALGGRGERVGRSPLTLDPAQSRVFSPARHIHGTFGTTIDCARQHATTHNVLICKWTDVVRCCCLLARSDLKFLARKGVPVRIRFRAPGYIDPKYLCGAVGLQGRVPQRQG
jgi:hypothetical protein